MCFFSFSVFLCEFAVVFRKKKKRHMCCNWEKYPRPLDYTLIRAMLDSYTLVVTEIFSQLYVGQKWDFSICMYVVIEIFFPKIFLVACGLKLSFLFFLSFMQVATDIFPVAWGFWLSFISVACVSYLRFSQLHVDRN
jgi:hypothetical protein